MASERSIHCLSWFASFVASLSGETIDTTEGAPAKHHAAIMGSQIAQPKEEVGANGTMGFPKGDAGCPNRYVISNQRQ